MKSKRKIIVFSILTLLLIISGCLLNSFGVVQVAGTYFNKGRKLPIYAVQTEENKLAISFDAAWGADKTSEIMDICDSYGIKATFFLVGFWVEEYPEKVKEIHNRGFEIGLHSNTHPDMTKLSKNQITEELETNINLIEDLTGETPKLFRPPFGYYNNDLIEVCESLNLSCIEWSVDSLDWKGLSASELSARVINKAPNISKQSFFEINQYVRYPPPIPSIKNITARNSIKGLDFFIFFSIVFLPFFDVLHSVCERFIVAFLVVFFAIFLVAISSPLYMSYIITFP